MVIVEGKRGQYKYYILINLILGLMVLAIGIFFIFNEYFTGEGADLEICRQSILLRANLPEIEAGGLTVTSFKKNFPLKCKTLVVEVDKGDLKEIDDIIGRTMAECWALFDKGDSSAFPLDIFPGGDSVCVPCARIHLTEDAKKIIKEKGNLNIRKALDSPMTNEYSYYNYLEESGKKFSAFKIGEGMEPTFSKLDFEIKENGLGEVLSGLGEIFFSDEKGGIVITSINKLTGGEAPLWKGGELFLPEEYNPDKGDLLISYGITQLGGETPYGNYIPYLFYFQTGQPSSPFSVETKKDYIGNVGLCETWEGIPA